MSWGEALSGLGSSVWNSVVGTPINNALSISAAQRNQRYAREQMSFQKEMSDTAHQREVEDLKKAGLNPLYSAMGMSGASTPSGQSGSISQASYEPSDVASAKDLLKWFSAQKDNVSADTDLKNEQKKTEKMKQDQIKQETAESSSRTGLNNNEYNYQMMTMPGRIDQVNSANAADAIINRIKKEHYDSEVGAGSKAAGFVLTDLLPMLNSATSLAKVPANVQNLRSYNPSYHYHK